MSSDDSFIKRIQKIDNELDTVTAEIAALKQRRDDLLQERREIFFNEKAPYVMKHRWTEENRECRFYIEADGEKQDIVSSRIPKSDPPEYVLRQIPERYLYDFLAEWQIVYQEKLVIKAERDKNFERAIKQMMHTMSLFPDQDAEELRIWKKMLNVLSMHFHPDNSATGNEKIMKYINKIKENLNL